MITESFNAKRDLRAAIQLTDGFAQRCDGSFGTQFRVMQFLIQQGRSSVVLVLVPAQLGLALKVAIVPLLCATEKSLRKVLLRQSRLV